MKRLLLILIVAGHVLASGAQQCTYSRSDSLRIVQLLGKGSTSPLDYARAFIGTPYVAATLEVNDDEQLVVNTRQLDCTTLVETVTAIVLCAQRHQTTFADYCAALQQLRYRGGVLDGYPSRLHYFSDWIDDKRSMGLVEEIQQNPPFTALQHIDVGYMSQHPQSYKALRNHPELLPKIASQEKALTGRTYRYIPKSQVLNTKAMREAVHDGDIIAITTSKKGLDIAHLGFAVWHHDGLHLLNASQIHKKVVEEPMTLKTYLSKHPSHTGIRIIRITNNKQ